MEQEYELYTVLAKFVDGEIVLRIEFNSDLEDYVDIQSEEVMGIANDIHFATTQLFDHITRGEE